MEKTNIDVSNFTTFAAATSNFYTPLFGTPAADIAYQISQKVKKCTQIESDKSMTDEEAGLLSEPSDENPGKYTTITCKGHTVPEDFLRINNIDTFVDESLETLKAGIEQGLYPEGTVQRAMVEYMIHGLEGIQNRNLALNDVSFELANKYPGIGMESKFANYVFIPKVAKEVEKDGKTELEFPEGFAEDDLDGMTFFVPRTDQQTAKYTMEEFQESADKVNFYNYNKAGLDYKETLIDVDNLMTMDNLDPARKTELKNKIVKTIDETEVQLKKAQEASIDDPVALRMFGGLKGQFEDTIKGTHRSFDGNMDSMDRYKAYLNAGFPPEGIEEYNSLRVNIFTLKNYTAVLGRDATNAGAFIEKLGILDQAINSLPPAGSDENARNAWADDIADKIDKVWEEYDKIAGKLTFVEKDFPMPDQNMPNKEELKRLGKDREEKIKSWENDKNRMQENFRKEGEDGKRIVEIKEIQKKHLHNFGKYTLQNRREALSKHMQGLSDTMSAMGTELKDLKEKNPNIPDSLKQAADRVIEASDPKSKSAPENYLRALMSLKTEAEKAGNEALTTWADGRIHYYGNRMKAASKKGMLTDEPLEAQRSAVHCPDGSKIDTALTKFDTKRSFIFGGWGQEHGKETQEHKDLREAAEALIRGKQELNDINDKTSPIWEQKAREVMQLTEDVRNLSDVYIGKKDASPTSPAGKERLQGAKDLAKEANAYRVSLKKQISANMKYNQIMATEHTYQKELVSKSYKSIKTNFDKIKKEVDVEKHQNNPAHDRKTISDVKHAEPKKDDKSRKSVL